MITWFGEGRKIRARLPEGFPFDATTLAIIDPPTSFHHEAFARSRRDFVHVYRSAKMGVLLRLTAKVGTVLDHPLLGHVHEHPRIVANQWIDGIPEVHPREPSTSWPSHVDLEASEKLEIIESVRRARESLGLKSNAKPSKAAEAIHSGIEKLRSGKRNSKEQRKQLALEYGTLWGESLYSAAGWEWRWVQLNPETKGCAVCDKNRTYTVDPIRVIHDILATKKAANNSLLLFNMIVSCEHADAPSVATWQASGLALRPKNGHQASPPWGAHATPLSGLSSEGSIQRTRAIRGPRASSWYHSPAVAHPCETLRLLRC